MRRLVAPTIAVALIGVACGSSITDVNTSPVAAEGATTVAEAADVATSSSIAPSAPAETSADGEETPTTAEPVAVLLPTGREALAAAQGSPHVLWFWGAH